MELLFKGNPRISDGSIAKFCVWPFTYASCGECSCISHKDETWCPNAGSYFFDPISLKTVKAK